MKLKTKIIHSFSIEEDLMDDLDFIMDVSMKSAKMKTKIIEVKRINTKKDASTRLF